MTVEDTSFLDNTSGNLFLGEGAGKCAIRGLKGILDEHDKVGMSRPLASTRLPGRGASQEPGTISASGGQWPGSVSCLPDPAFAFIRNPITWRSRG